MKSSLILTILFLLTCSTSHGFDVDVYNALVEQGDLAGAKSFLVNASEGGDLKAALYLGIILQRNDPLPTDFAGASYWLNYTCEQATSTSSLPSDQIGFACFQAGSSILKTSEETALRLFLKGTLHYYPDSAIMAAKLFLERDTKPADKRAFELLCLILKDNEYTAFTSTVSKEETELLWGTMLYKGLGTKQDRPRAYAAFSLLLGKERVNQDQVKNALKVLKFQMSDEELAAGEKLLAETSKIRDLLPQSGK